MRADHVLGGMVQKGALSTIGERGLGQETPPGGGSRNLAMRMISATRSVLHGFRVGRLAVSGAAYFSPEKCFWAKAMFCTHSTVPR